MHFLVVEITDTETSTGWHEAMHVTKHAKSLGQHDEWMAYSTIEKIS